jgi:HEAT repeat protein
MRCFVLELSLLCALGCGSTATPVGSPPPLASLSGSAQNDAPCPSTEDQTALEDAAILALAQATKKCEFSGAQFSWDCPEFKAWREPNKDLFEDVAGNPTLLAMLEDADIRMRALVVERGFVAGRTFFANKQNAARLLAVLDRERETSILRAVGKLVAQIDGERAFGKELEGLTKHPSSEFRKAFAGELLPQHPTEFSLKLVKLFLEDPDWGVRRAALRSLGSDEGTRSTGPVCGFLKSQMVRNDKLASDAILAGLASDCPGMLNDAMAQVEKRAQAPAATLNEEDFDPTSRLSSLCWSSETPDAIKTRAFNVAVTVATKLEGSWPKRSWLGLLRHCDVNRAKAALAPFSKDSDSDVAELATSEMQRVDEELANK